MRRSLTTESEGRETQAAESWRVRPSARAHGGPNETLAISAFQAITNDASRLGQPKFGAFMCEGARYAEILGVIPSKPTRIQTFNLRV